MTAPKHGYEPQAWEKAKTELQEALIAHAKAQATVSYSELVKQIQSIKLQPNSAALAALLVEVSTDEAAAKRGMLSVVAVHKHGDQLPGSGFFELAKQLGRDTSDKVKCWVEELNEVYGVWSRR
jgi:hypothetical protein